MNSLSMSSELIWSVLSLCMCKIMMWFNLVCVMADRKNVFRRRKAENVRSAVADGTGIVNAMCNRLSVY